MMLSVPAIQTNEGDWLNKTLPVLFEEQVERTPDVPAIVFADRQLTYRELNNRANAYARLLQSYGVGPEVVVGMYSQRARSGIEQSILFWAIQKASGVLLYLDSELPTERLEFLLEDAYVRVLVVDDVEEDTDAFDGNALSGLPQGAIPLISISDEEEESFLHTGNPAHALELSNAAYIVTTSGSTGIPKCVVIPHKGLGNLAQSQITFFEVQPGDRVLQFASWSFDASISEILMTHLSGACLYPVTEETSKGSDALLHFLQLHAITHATLTPSVLSTLTHADLPDLRTLVSAGERCTAALVERWSTNTRTLWNAYGPSEASVCATMGRCESNGAAPSIGLPLPHVRVSIWDVRTHQPVADGETGEIVLGGIGLARGYTSAELTQDRFLSTHHGRMYLTGDLGYINPDGTLIYVGRVPDDMQVKVHGGMRVELGEIEAALAQSVEMCGVVLVDGVLVAAVVFADEEQGLISSDFLRASLEEVLPSYMIPKAFVQVKRLPRTPNDKIDRNALEIMLADWRHAGRGQEEEQRELVTSLSSVAVELATLVANAINRSYRTQLRADDIDLSKTIEGNGGDSLLAQDVLLDIAKILHVHVTEVELDSLTVEQIAGLITVRQAHTEEERKKVEA